MTDDSKLQDEPPLIGGKTFAEWNSLWQHVPDGFTELQSQLRRDIGLFAAKAGTDFYYIGAAAQVHNGGLRAGLARARLRDQTNNSSGGLRVIRDNIVGLDSYVLIVPQDNKSKINLFDLKWAMIDHYQPRWNSPRDLVTARRKARYAH